MRDVLQVPEVVLTVRTQNARATDHRHDRRESIRVSQRQIPHHVTTTTHAGAVDPVFVHVEPPSGVAQGGQGELRHRSSALPRVNQIDQPGQFSLEPLLGRAGLDRENQEQGERPRQ